MLGRLDLVGGQRALGAGEQPVHHLLVPAGGDDRDPQVVAVDGLLVGRSGSAHEAAPSGTVPDRPGSWCPIRSRLVSRYAMLWSLGRVVSGTRSATGTP